MPVQTLQLAMLCIYKPMVGLTFCTVNNKQEDTVKIIQYDRQCLLWICNDHYTGSARGHERVDQVLFHGLMRFTKFVKKRR